MTEKVVGVEDLLAEDSASFTTQMYAGRITVMELRLTTFKMAMHSSENCVLVICGQQKQIME